MTTSTRYHHGDLPAAILGSAGEILEKEGIAALSMREAARRAGVSHNAPYRHFPDREALLAALAAEGFDRLGERLSGRSGADMGVAYVAFALEHPQRFRLMFGGQVPIAAHPELRARAQAAFEALQGAFAGVGSPGQSRYAAAAAWALVHGLAELLLEGHLARSGGGDPLAFARAVLGTVRFAVGRPA